MRPLYGWPLPSKPSFQLPSTSFQVLADIAKSGQDAAAALAEAKTQLVASNADLATSFDLSGEPAAYKADMQTAIDQAASGRTAVQTSADQEKATLTTQITNLKAADDKSYNASLDDFHAQGGTKGTFYFSDPPAGVQRVGCAAQGTGLHARASILRQLAQRLRAGRRLDLRRAPEAGRRLRSTPAFQAVVMGSFINQQDVSSTDGTTTIDVDSDLSVAIQAAFQGVATLTTYTLASVSQVFLGSYGHDRTIRNRFFLSKFQSVF